MLKILKNEKGNLAIAMLIVILATISGFALAAVANNDAVIADIQLSSVQETHLLRSEIGRGYMAIGNDASSTGTLILPVRKIEVNSRASKTTYAMKTKIAQTFEQGSNVSQASRRTISSKIKAFKKPASSISYNSTDKKVPIEKYAEKIIQKDTFAGFMYLTNYEESVNGDEVHFYGADHIWGRVHSNSDIHIQNVGGWPVFEDFVTTTGVVVSESGSYPEDQVFLGGLEEEVGEIVFNPSADLIRQNGLRPFPDHYEIIYVDIQGSSFEAKGCDIIDTGEIDTLIIYDSYPPYGPVGDSIGVNYLPIIDSSWVDIPGMNVNGQSVFVESELWIKGEVSGKQTWGCEEDIYIIDDIWYSNTVKGENPDGAEGDPENTTDFLGLVSEKQIIIQYGYRDPTAADSVRLKPNCDDVYIYGALCALADEADPHEDGIFTFQYHYPHPSTEAVWYQGEYYDKVDMHLFKYPTSAFSPWPQDLDYPYYNPLWPEGQSDLVFERGEIYLFGAVSQVRRGFVHRSGSDVDNGAWDLDNYIYGGATFQSSGYNKRYHYDHRFMHTPPPDFPEVHVKGGTTPFQGLALRFKTPPSMY